MWIRRVEVVNKERHYANKESGGFKRSGGGRVKV